MYGQFQTSREATSSVSDLLKLDSSLLSRLEALVVSPQMVVVRKRSTTNSIMPARLFHATEHSKVILTGPARSVYDVFQALRRWWRCKSRGGPEALNTRSDHSGQLSRRH